MTRTITATYSSAETLKNVSDDLINIGLPAEEIFADSEKKEIKVITGMDIKAEILEVLKRHEPLNIKE